MARPHRTDEAGAVHHVMIRGIDGRTIFRSERDFEDFLARFGWLVRELRFVVLAWCLIGNHAHFVLKTGDVPLAVLMQRLNTWKAQRFNWQAERVGHVFQGRYKALRIASDGQLGRSCAYALGNAIRHAVVPPERGPDYQWSGYGALVGNRPPRDFECLETTASALGVERSQMASFIEREALEVASIGSALEPDQIDELNRLIVASCARHGVDARALAAAEQRARAARAEICRRASDALDVRLNEVARRIGVSRDAARRLVTSTAPS